MNKININEIELPKGISFVSIQHDKVYDRMAMGYDVLGTIVVFKHDATQNIYGLGIYQDEVGNIDLRWMDKQRNRIKNTFKEYSTLLEPIADQIANKLV